MDFKKSIDKQFFINFTLAAFCVLLGIIQVLRNQEVPPTGLGKYDGVMTPVLRQGWVVKQNMT